MAKIEFTSEKRQQFDGWSRRCRVSGVDFTVYVTRGKRVVIPYKPRGHNIGYKWNGTVYDNTTGRRIWADDVPGSIGVRGLLKAAGVIE